MDNFEEILKSNGVSDGRGTALDEFADISDEKAFKDNYRQAMNDLPIDEATQKELSMRLMKPLL